MLIWAPGTTVSKYSHTKQWPWLDKAQSNCITNLRLLSNTKSNFLLFLLFVNLSSIFPLGFFHRIPSKILFAQWKRHLSGTHSLFLQPHRGGDIIWGGVLGWVAPCIAAGGWKWRRWSRMYTSLSKRDVLWHGYTGERLPHLTGKVCHDWNVSK